MAYTHVAHDVRIGDHVILGNSVGLAGHVTVEDWVDIGPYSGVHQFCRIGRHAFIGPYSVVKQDVMPYSLTSHKPRDRRYSAPTASAWSGAAFENRPWSRRCRPRSGC